MNCTACSTLILLAYLFDHCVLCDATCHKKCIELTIHSDNLWLCQNCINKNLPFSDVDETKDSLAHRITSENLMDVYLDTFDHNADERSLLNEGDLVADLTRLPHSQVLTRISLYFMNFPTISNFQIN